MNGKEFIPRTQRWARARGVDVRVDASRGKGGHQILTVGERCTTVQTGELQPGIYFAMLKQLGIAKEEF